MVFQNSYIEAPTFNVMVLRGGAFMSQSVMDEVMRRGLQDGIRVS